MSGPPDERFQDPVFDEPTPLTITREGRIYGHLAPWNACHTGYPGQCVTAPRSASGYAYFHLGGVVTAAGRDLACGQITLGTGHAGRGLNSEAAARHYDDTGVAVADVVCGEDRFGAWFSGALRDGLSAERVRELRGAKLSGDWRRLNGQLELVGLLAVNVPGFPVTRPAVRVASGVPMTLVASLGPSLDAAGYRRRLDRLWGQANPDAALEALAARARDR